jgi:hypothetical protein
MPLDDDVSSVEISSGDGSSGEPADSSAEVL